MGDICRDKVSFARNFVFHDINSLANDPWRPYHSAKHRFVRAWFSASDGGDLRRFVQLISERNQDRPMQQGGACIVYTHFAFGFSRNGKVDPEFTALIRKLSRLPGCFVPVSELLNHLKARRRDENAIRPWELRRLQSRWLRDALLQRQPFVAP